MKENEFYLAGIHQMKLGNYEQAKRIFTQAIATHPSNADFYSERGVARFHLNNLKGALSDMNQAQQMEPNKPYRYSSRAFIKDALKDVHGAIADYRMAIQLDPEDDIAYNNLGLLEEKLGFKKMAKERFETADQLSTTKTGRQHTDEAITLNQKEEALFESFKRELNLEVKDAEVNGNDTALKLTEKRHQTVWKTALSVFYSKKALRDYLTYLRKLVRVTH
jgi:Flp pilus assembly protein TadD